MTRTEALDRGRDALRRQMWGAACAHLTAADREAPLDPEDLAGLAHASRLLGKTEQCTEFLARAHQTYLAQDRLQPAARCGFWLGFLAMLDGDSSQASGWLARSARLLEGQPECVEMGYLLIPAAMREAQSGDPDVAREIFIRAADFGGRFNDGDLTTMALQGQGRSLIRSGEVARGVSLLDEAMIAVTAGEVSPMVAGGVYCSVIDACGEIFDLRRAREWTLALEKWCASQPDTVPYRGHCLIRRAELLQLQGAWSDAREQARLAHECMSQPIPKPGVGAALYQLAELHRLRGEFAQAEGIYTQAAKSNRESHLGLARLRFAQGQLDTAAAAIRRLAAETQKPGVRAHVLDAFVEIVLAAKDISAARAAAEELSEIANRNEAVFLRALSSRASGAVLLAETDPRGALLTLRQSWLHWCELEAPYEAARVRVLLALACRALGDEDAAEVELAAAHDAFEQLGAPVDLARVKKLLAAKATSSSGPLTTREREVLKLVAAGLTNRTIAQQLHISEKTVARHISNIFTKLDLPSRAAATAYAYQNDLA